MPEQRHPTTPQPSAPDEEPTDESIVHVALAGLLPPGHILALHRFLGTLSHLTLVQEQPRMLLEQLFSTTEVSLLLPLLEQYPDYCPYEVLWANFHGSISEKAIARAHTRAHHALACPAQAPGDGAGYRLALRDRLSADSARPAALAQEN